MARNNNDKQKRGFKAMQEEGREDEVRDIASQGGSSAQEKGSAHELTPEERSRGGKNSSGSFEKGSDRAREAGSKSRGGSDQSEYNEDED